MPPITTLPDGGNYNPGALQGPGQPTGGTSPQGPTANPTDQSSALLQMLGQITGQGNAGIQSQYNNLLGQYGFLQPQFNNQQSQINQNLNYQLGQYGLQQTGLQQEQANIGTNYGYTQQQQALEAGGLNQSLAQALFGEQQQQRSTQGSATASGVNTTSANRQNLSDIAKQYAFTKEGIQRQQAQLGISEQQAKTQEQYQLQQITNQLKGLGMSETQARTLAQQQLQAANLQLSQGQLGIQGQLQALAPQLAGNTLGSLSTLYAGAQG